MIKKETMKKFFGLFLKRENLFLRVAAGFAVGIVLGVLFPGLESVAKTVGDAYLNIIKALVIPVSVCAVFSGITSVRDGKLLRRTGLATVVLFVLMFLISSLLSFSIARIIRPGSNFVLSSDLVFTQGVARLSLSGFLDSVITSNIFKSMAEGNILPLILFTVLFAVAVIRTGEKGTKTVELVNSIMHGLFSMVDMLMQLSPLGVAAYMVYSVSRFGSALFGLCAKYIACCWLSCLATFAVVIVLPACVLGRAGLKNFIKACGKISLVSFATASSVATLPVTMEVSVRDLGAEADVSHFVLPLGCTINMCGGACSFCCLAVFTADIYGMELRAGTVIAMFAVALLLNMAAPGIPGGGIVLGATFLSIFGFPFDIMVMISGFYRLLDMAFTTINVLGDVSADLIVCRFVNGSPSIRP